jgi:hypothetical protein
LEAVVPVVLEDEQAGGSTGVPGVNDFLSAVAVRVADGWITYDVDERWRFPREVIGMSSQRGGFVDSDEGSPLAHHLGQSIVVQVSRLEWVVVRNILNDQVGIVTLLLEIAGPNLECSSKMDNADDLTLAIVIGVAERAVPVIHPVQLGDEPERQTGRCGCRRRLGTPKPVSQMDSSIASRIGNSVGRDVDPAAIGQGHRRPLRWMVLIGDCRSHTGGKQEKHSSGKCRSHTV